MNDWRFRESRGPNDAVAPHSGGYWITEDDDLDLVARIWHDDEADTWRYDVTEADEVEYNGTPCVRGAAATRVVAMAAVDTYMRAVHA